MVVVVVVVVVVVFCFLFLFFLNIIINTINKLTESIGSVRWINKANINSGRI